MTAPTLRVLVGKQFEPREDVTAAVRESVSRSFSSMAAGPPPPVEIGRSPEGVPFAVFLDDLALPISHRRFEQAVSAGCGAFLRTGSLARADLLEANMSTDDTPAVCDALVAHALYAGFGDVAAVWARPAHATDDMDNERADVIVAAAGHLARWGISPAGVRWDELTDGPRDDGSADDDALALAVAALDSGESPVGVLIAASRATLRSLTTDPTKVAPIPSMLSFGPALGIDVPLPSLVDSPVPDGLAAGGLAARDTPRRLLLMSGSVATDDAEALAASGTRWLSDPLTGRQLAVVEADHPAAGRLGALTACRLFDRHLEQDARSVMTLWAGDSGANGPTARIVRRVLAADAASVRFDHLINQAVDACAAGGVTSIDGIVDASRRLLGSGCLGDWPLSPDVEVIEVEPLGATVDLVADRARLLGDHPQLEHGTRNIVVIADDPDRRRVADALRPLIDVAVVSCHAEVGDGFATMIRTTGRSGT